MGNSKILLLEPDSSLSDLMVFSLESTFGLDVLTAKTCQEGIAHLSKNSEVVLVVAHPSLPDGSSEAILSYLEEGSLQVPFILTGVANPDTLPEFIGRATAGCVEKTQVIHPLNSMVDYLLPDTLKNGQGEFVKIHIGTLKYFKELNEDLYIQLTNGEKRFVKIFSKGDQLTSADIERKRQKGVELLYLKREEALRMVNFLEEKVGSRQI